MQYSHTQSNEGGDYANYLKAWEQAQKEAELLMDKDDRGEDRSDEIEKILIQEKFYAAGKSQMAQEADDKECKEIMSQGTFRQLDGAEWQKEQEEHPQIKPYSTLVVRTAKQRGMKGENHEATDWILKARMVVCDNAGVPHRARANETGKDRYFRPHLEAPTSSAFTKRIFYQMASALGIEILVQVDFTGAFLNAEVDPRAHIYVRPHPALKTHLKGSTIMLKVLKYLYGLREAPAMWFRHVTGNMKKMGFKTLCKAFDCCLMYKREPPGADGKQRVVFCIIHVDDMMWADTTGSSMIKGAVKELEEHYKGKVKHN